MGLLDVTSDLYDDDFIDAFIVISSLVDVDAYGLAEATRQGVPATGSVQPASGRDLIQFGEGDMVSGAIKIFTLYPLTTGDAHRGADRIIWEGALYTVSNVQSYRNYAGGLGHVEALAKLTTTNPSVVPGANDGGFLGP